MRTNQEGRAVTDQPAIQDPEPLRVPSTGFLVEYDSQVYVVSSTTVHVHLNHDSLGREQHLLDVHITAKWQEEGYQDSLEEML